MAVIFEFVFIFIRFTFVKMPELIIDIFTEKGYTSVFQYHYNDYLGLNNQLLFKGSVLCKDYNSEYNCVYLPQVQAVISYYDTNYVYYYKCWYQHMSNNSLLPFDFSDHLIYL